MRNPDAPIDEWGPVSDEVRGYKITPDDILIHWDTPDNPLDNPRWGWEREIILKPDASPRRLSETEKKKEMKRIHHHHHHHHH